MSEAVCATSGLNAPVSNQTPTSPSLSSTESVDSQTPLLTKSGTNNTSIQVGASVNGVNISLPTTRVKVRVGSQSKNC